ncbi:MAG: PP0621 family protein [Gammaproteobacteria bacterium]|nr:PP0621 family protein [Gammaproteobacteria bacterium]
MEELLRLVLILVAVWFLVRALRRSGARGGASPPPPRNSPPESVPMLRCARCGVYVPHDQAVTAHGRTFCSREHASRGPRR